MPQASFHIRNLGCRVNRVESDLFAAALLNSGARQCSASQADLIIVNTCTVTAEADAKTRKCVRSLLKQAPDARLICCGCSVCMNEGFYASLDPRIEILKDKDQVIPRALKLLGLEASPLPAFSRSGEGFMTRAGLKIQDGCDNSCSYCIVRHARGPARFRSMDSILEEARAASEAGIAELVLTGINLGSYPDLPGLIREILRVSDSGVSSVPLRIRLSSIEPQDVDELLLDTMAQAGERVCHYLHMPLQSGSSRTLAAMNRRYDAEGFAGKVELCRSYMPDIAIGSDIIVGFPGESETEFREHLDFCRNICFSRCHIFRYSVRPGTPAAAMKNQIAPEIKAQRAERMQLLADECSALDRQRRIGSEEQMVLEHFSSNGDGRLAFGTLSSFHTACLRLEPEDSCIRQGSLLNVRLEGVNGEMLSCIRSSAKI